MTTAQLDAVRSLRSTLAAGGCHHTLERCVEALRATNWKVYAACLWLAGALPKKLDPPLEFTFRGVPITMDETT